YKNIINLNSSSTQSPDYNKPTLGVFLGSSTNKSSTDTLNISDKAVDFLKGLLVTRIMPSFYIFIILISLPLNALALVAFTCRIREKKPAVIYMSHLACVDLLFTLLLPLKIHYQLNASDWVFGEAACRVISAAYYCYMYCSILLMMCMSVDRLLAVAFPVASLTWRSTRKATCVCVLVWLLAIAGTVPLLLVRQTVKTENVGVTCHDVLRKNYTTVMYYVYLFSILSCLYFFLKARCICVLVWLLALAGIAPLLALRQTFSFKNLGVTCFDLLDEDSSVMLYLSVFLIIPCIYFFLPLVVILVTTSASSSDNRKRAAIMATAVLTEFVVCFAPSNGFLLYHCVCIAMGSSGLDTYLAYLLAVCLGSSSVFLDPLLYYYGSSHKAKTVNTPSNHAIILSVTLTQNPLI
uniref:G-protein coupled receptors family 1 profile domain-containing protein n=1 Tax=Sinocyclocheilus rhinocerous TaxID=307959 RepID=A0A673HI20_9TELE